MANYTPYVGMEVICNGLPGTIVKVCEWAEDLVEVDLPNGTVCVPAQAPDCYPNPNV